MSFPRHRILDHLFGASQIAFRLFEQRATGMRGPSMERHWHWF